MEPTDPDDFYEWQCDYCPCRFNTYRNALSHENRIHVCPAITTIQHWWLGAWACDFCGKRFRNRDAATHHENLMHRSGAAHKLQRWWRACGSFVFV